VRASGARGLGGERIDGRVFLRRARRGEPGGGEELGVVERGGHGGEGDAEDAEGEADVEPPGVDADDERVGEVGAGGGGDGAGEEFAVGVGELAEGALMSAERIGGAEGGFVDDAAEELGGIDVSAGPGGAVGFAVKGLPAVAGFVVAPVGNLLDRGEKLQGLVVIVGQMQDKGGVGKSGGFDGKNEVSGAAVGDDFDGAVDGEGGGGVIDGGAGVEAEERGGVERRGGHDGMKGARSGGEGREGAEQNDSGAGYAGPAH